MFKPIFQITALAISLLAIALFTEETAHSQSLPTVPTIGNQQSAQVSDFTKISLENLPQVQVTTQLRQQLSQLLSPSALNNLAVGSMVSPDRYLTVGSFQSMGLEQMNLEAIAGRSGVSLANVSLGQLGDLVSQQTISSLLQSLPNLSDLPVSQVKPILDLAMQQTGLASLNGELSSLTVGQLMNALPDLGNLSFSSLGDQLNTYSLDAIPGFAELPLGNIAGASSILLSNLNVVGLSKLSLSQFPNAPTLLPNVRLGMVDIALGTKEKTRINPISGGVTEAGFQAVPCDASYSECPHIEVTDLLGGYYNGKQWMTAAQQVPDGYGFLGNLFGNRGPAGNHPFGDAFRVTIESLDEASGTISLGLRFRWCQKSWFVDLGCTPYITPPLPFLVLREKSTIPYLIPSNATTNVSISPPKNKSQKSQSK